MLKSFKLWIITIELSDILKNIKQSYKIIIKMPDAQIGNQFLAGIFLIGYQTKKLLLVTSSFFE